MTLVVSWAMYFAAVFGLAYIVGHARISLPFRLLLGGQAAQTVIGIAEIPGSETRVLPAIPPLVPVLGPFIVELLECPACFGFWEGLVAGLFISPLAAGGLWEVGPTHGVLWCIWLGCATAGVNFLLGRATRLI